MAAHLKYKSGSSWVDYNLVVYPVGAIYLGFSSTSPASLFGGTWTPITGRFLYCNAGTGTGGNNSVSHTHGLSSGFAKIDIGNSIGIVQVNTGINYTVTKHLLGTVNAASWQTPFGVPLMGNSNSASISTMPSYQTVYAWRRTA